MSKMIHKAVAEYLKAIGRKGGHAAKGERKRRGDREFYAKIGRLSAEARARKKAENLRKETVNAESTKD